MTLSNRVTLALQGELCFKTAGILCCCTRIYNILESLLQKHILGQSIPEVYSLVLKLLIQCCKKLLQIIFMNSCYISEILWEPQFLRSPAKETINQVKEVHELETIFANTNLTENEDTGYIKNHTINKKRARKTYGTINNRLSMKTEYSN